MRGDENNRWLFAAMGLTTQMHQLEAFKPGKSTWNIRAGFGINSLTPQIFNI